MYSAQGAGTLREVIVHCPGDELDILNPWNLKEYLFDALVQKDEASEEHKQFIEKLEQSGVKVHQLGELITRIKSVRGQRFVRSVVGKLPNMFFVRDLAVVTSDGAIISNMRFPARGVEPIVIRRVLEELGIKILVEIKPPGTLEGGDVIFLDRNTALVGLGERTNEDGIRQLRQAWLREGRALAKVFIEPWRASMHLDTVMGILSRHCICAHLPGIQRVTVHWIQDGDPMQKDMSMEEFLGARGAEVIDVTSAEQFNMACNSLMVEPDRKIICYDRSFKDSVRELRRRKVQLSTLYLPQLFIGGGGPHCMTLELKRDAE